MSLKLHVFAMKKMVYSSYFMEFKGVKIYFIINFSFGQVDYFFRK